MTTPGDRFKGWIDGLATAWGVRLGSWAAKFVAGGMAGFGDMIGKKASEQLAPMIAKLEAGGVPPELKPILDELKKPTGEIAALTGMGFLNRVIGGIKGNIFEYFTRSITHAFSYSADFFLPDSQLAIAYYRRHLIPDKETLYGIMRSNGFTPEDTDKLLAASELRFPSEIVGKLALRDKAKWGKYWDDVLQLGVDPARLEGLKELEYKVPGVGDVIRYMVKEVYTPEVYKAFGQDQEFPGGAVGFTADPLGDAEATGVRREHLLKEWIAHWVLPSSGQGFDLLHRGEITAAELGKLLKALDIMPFWRDKLTALSWDVPNRVELRLLARYGLVDRPFLIEALRNAGLREDYRPILADLMLAQGLMTDMSRRYANKWISADEVKAELVSVGLEPKIRDRMYTWIIKNNAGERTKVEKDLTAAEIIKGVKKLVISWDEGLQQLMALGYDEVEANYKMAIDVEVTQEAVSTATTVQVDTIRRLRRQRLLSRDQEIAALVDLNIESELAVAYADNDNLRLVKETTGG